MNSKIFSYKVPGVTLQTIDDDLSISPVFDRKAILEPLKEIFKQENYKIDEASLNYKLIDDQLFIQGLAIENEEPKIVGFRFGKGE
ncbi:hypothetical protein KXD93_02090 [Mucilaginibacter sp. BJC16-A38]|uniref:hypothetical protein n=1 Tax=Mucilaginibacter phenanthrenivorans TaxID=1234842 RepID=UPI002157C898|nr:hypothetical protein [Mucilaginibacter phenanthrenivorans]MCR8556411.1 hypothetical protein [Mucilaginibacter phenanthrenivorans]